MSRLGWLAALGLVAMTAAAEAQDLRVEPRKPAATATSISPTPPTPTQEMWFYEQSQRAYKDPATAVRRKAELDTAQRQNRLATSRWFGVSNARPACNATPHMSTYGPSWASNTGDAQVWDGNQTAPPTMLLSTPYTGRWFW